MKIQDVAFFAVFILLLLRQNPKWSAITGLILLAISIPLFSLLIFFTAQRLTWYAAAFFFLSTALLLIKNRRHER